MRTKRTNLSKWWPFFFFVFGVIFDDVFESVVFGREYSVRLERTDQGHNDGSSLPETDRTVLVTANNDIVRDVRLLVTVFKMASIDWPLL